MRFIGIPIAGAWLIELEPHVDERGFFSRTFCAREFAAHGLEVDFVQCNLSYNERRGTLRGLHYQAQPKPETKLVRCDRGALYDVIVDLRCNSPSFRKWFGIELTADNGRMVYVPEGCAHGYQTLTDHASLSYQISEFYEPSLALGIRWDDPDLGIDWPLPFAPILSDRDRALPTLRAMMAQTEDLRA